MRNKTVLASQNQKSDYIWIALIGALIIIIAILHYSTPIRLHHLHELYRIFFYFPIILAVYRYQIKGGIYAAFAVVVIYLPHVVFQWGGDFWFNFSRFLEMVMYLVIGIVAGILAQRELSEREKYQYAALGLEEMVQKLKSQSEKLAEIEEQLLHADRLSVLGELSASLAHEVRNPLGSIWGVVEILKDKCQFDQQSAEFMDILVREVKRLNEVVENYLALAKNPQLKIKACNLLDIVQSIIHLIESKAKKQQINIQVDFPEHPLFIKADENQLRQVLINLLLNSMSAISESGNISIRAKIEEHTIEGNRNQMVYLSISDSGEGIQPDIFQDMFKPFFTTKEYGTGLGLSIVKRIIDQNKWQIMIETENNAGTTATIIIPVEEAHV